MLSTRTYVPTYSTYHFLLFAFCFPSDTRGLSALIFELALSLLSNLGFPFFLSLLITTLDPLRLPHHYIRLLTLLFPMAETTTLDISAVADAVASAVKLGPPPPALPQGWILKGSRSNPGYFYYFHMETGMTSWQPPILERQPDEQEEQEQQEEPEQVPQVVPEKIHDEPDENEERSSKRRKAANSSEGPAEVRVLHILKKHKDSRRPSSWRQPVISQSLEEAKEEIQGLLEILQEEEGNPEELRATFEELARTESDCSSAKRGGDLGFFGRRKMQPGFEEASFGLQINQLTKEIVETSSGVHLIYRIG